MHGIPLGRSQSLESLPKSEPADARQEGLSSRSEEAPTSHEEKMEGPDAEQFYHVMEQNGELVDVDEHTDLTTLPPEVKLIRHADGSVTRIRF